MPNLSTEAALLPARLFFLSNLFTCILKGFSIKNLSFGRKTLRRGRPLLSFYFNFLARETSCLVSNFEECWHSSVWTGCCNIRGIKDKMKRTISWTELRERTWCGVRSWATSPCFDPTALPFVVLGGTTKAKGPLTTVLGVKRLFRWGIKKLKFLPKFQLSQNCLKTYWKLNFIRYRSSPVCFWMYFFLFLGKQCPSGPIIINFLPI